MRICPLSAVYTQSTQTVQFCKNLHQSTSIYTSRHKSTQIYTSWRFTKRAVQICLEQSVTVHLAAPHVAFARPHHRLARHAHARAPCLWGMTASEYSSFACLQQVYQMVHKCCRNAGAILHSILYILNVYFPSSSGCKSHLVW